MATTNEKPPLRKLMTQFSNRRNNSLYVPDTLPIRRYAFSFNQTRTSSWLPVIINCSRFGLKKRKITRIPREIRNSKTSSRN
jgi:hypothetical protein